jgi:hypothetical protein
MDRLTDYEKKLMIGLLVCIAIFLALILRI